MPSRRGCRLGTSSLCGKAKGPHQTGFADLRSIYQDEFPLSFEVGCGVHRPPVSMLREFQGSPWDSWCLTESLWDRAWERTCGAKTAGGRTSAFLWQRWPGLSLLCQKVAVFTKMVSGAVWSIDFLLEIQYRFCIHWIFWRKGTWFDPFKTKYLYPILGSQSGLISWVGHLLALHHRHFSWFPLDL